MYCVRFQIRFFPMTFFYYNTMVYLHFKPAGPASPENKNGY